MSKRNFKRVLPCALFMMCSALLVSATRAASFEPIDVPNPLSHRIPPYATSTEISPDGQIVAGVISLPGAVVDCWAGCSNPFVWSQTHGLAASSVLQPVNVYERKYTPFRVYPDRPVAISNHSILFNATAGTFNEPVLISAEGTQFLRSALPGNQSLYATAMSQDVSVIVGTNSAWNSESDAFIWTAEDGLRELSAVEMYPTAVSGNGRVVAGTALISNYGRDTSTGFYWTESDGLRAMPAASNGLGFSPTAADFSGSTIVGHGWINGNSQPLAWDDQLGTRRLELPENYLSGSAADITADGAIVLGVSWTKEIVEPALGDQYYGESLAVLWDQSRQVHDLRKWLVENYHLGEELAGWSLTSANAISANGRVIAGVGVNPNGDLQGWVVTIPEPSAICIVALSGGVFLSLRRFQRRPLVS